MGPSEEELRERVARAAELVRAGGLVVYPTETFYALGALAFSSSALARLASAKRRPLGKSLPLIAGDESQVERVAVLEGPLARRLASRVWPGPVTLVLPAVAHLPPELVAPDQTVAVRIPGSELARRLALESGGPLVSTSANLSGEPPPWRVESLSKELLAGVAGVLDGGPTPGGRPSTLVLVLRDSLRLVREGAVSLAEIEAACK